jgi:hypothetical protein
MIYSSRRLLFTLAAAVTALSGCVRESTVGQQHVFTYELWVPVSVLLAGIVAVPVGWVLRGWWARLGWGMLIMGPIAAIVVAPSLLRDRIAVDDHGFTMRTGIWGLTSVHEVSFENLRRVRAVAEKGTGRGADYTHHFLMCEMKDGGLAKVPVNNSVSETAAPHILKALEQHGIPVVD